MKGINLFLIIPLIPFNTFAYSLQDYLGDVKNKHLGIEASQDLKESANLKSQEATLQFRPYLFGQAQTLSDKKQGVSNAYGTETDINTYSLGVGNKFDFGLDAKVSYSLNSNEYINSSSAVISVPKYNENKLQLDLNLPLFRNFNSTEDKFKKVQLEEAAKITNNSEDYKTKSILIQAEILYYKLALQQKIIEVNRETLERAKKIREWADRRDKLELADKADALQAESSVRFRELELKSALADEKTLLNEFNKIRGFAGNSTVNDLQIPNETQLKQLKAPASFIDREDLQILASQKELAILNQKAVYEKFKPQIDLYASFAQNGKNVDSGEAISRSLGRDYATNVIGIKFSAPLDFPIINEVKKGASLEKLSAEKNLERKKYELDIEFNDLVERFSEAKEKLDLARNIETIQKEKADHERSRLSKGKTIAFQVLTFEQDLASAKVLRLQNHLNVLSLYTQLKLYSKLNGGN